MKKVFLAVCVAVSLVNCSDTEDNSVIEPVICIEPLEIIGSWTLVSSSGGIDGKVTNYEGQFIPLVITQDSVIQKGKDYLNYAYKYHIEVKQSIFGGAKRMIVADNHNHPDMSFERKDNNLYLSEECADCYGYTYIRK